MALDFSIFGRAFGLYTIVAIPFGIRVFSFFERIVFVSAHGGYVAGRSLGRQSI
jgi:hypothetical protein